MKISHLVASEVFLLLLLTGCANLPMDEACRVGIEKEFETLFTDDYRLRLDSPSSSFVSLSAAVGSEQVGDYKGCLKNLNTARRHRRVNGYYALNTHYSPRNSTQNSYPQAGRTRSGGGSASYDAAHHAAGHTHHHGH